MWDIFKYLKKIETIMWKFKWRIIVIAFFVDEWFQRTDKLLTYGIKCSKKFDIDSKMFSSEKHGINSR